MYWFHCCYCREAVAFIAAHGYMLHHTNRLFIFLVFVHREAVTFVAAHGYKIHITSLFYFYCCSCICIWGGCGLCGGASVHVTPHLPFVSFSFFLVIVYREAVAFVAEHGYTQYAPYVRALS